MKKTKKGFTLVELVIVVAVMAVLVAVAIPTVGAITDSAKDSVAKTNAQTIESMLKLYEAEHEVDDSGNAFEWTNTSVAAAINEAKLGITDDKKAFVFDATKGSVIVYKTQPTEDDQFTIKFTTAGVASAEEKGAFTVSEDEE